MRSNLRTNVMLLAASLLGTHISAMPEMPIRMYKHDTELSGAFGLARAAHMSTGNPLNQRQRRKRNRQTQNFK